MKFVPLGSIADIQLGKMLSPKSKTGKNSFPYLRNQNVQWGRIDLTDLAFMDFDEREQQKFSLHPGDLLVCEGGEPGRCAIWVDERTDCFYQKALHRIRPHKGKADAEYLSFWIRHQAQSGAFEDQNSKTTIAHLPLVRLEQMLVPDIVLAEQRKTATLLKEQLAIISKAIDASKTQFRESEALNGAIYRLAFNDIVPVAVPPSFQDAPNGWRWSKLIDIARLESGHTPSRSRPDWWAGDISWISLTEVRRLDGKWTNETQIKTNEAGIANSAARVLPRGTVCFSRTASVGFVTVMGMPMSTSQDFANWVCGDALDPDFLMHALIRSRAELRAIATGATHKTIYMPALNSFHICLPSREAQGEIVRKLTAQLDANKAIHASAKENLTLLQELQSHAFAQVFEQSKSAR